MDHRRFFRVLSLLLIFALLAGAFALAEEDVSITIYDNQGNVVAGDGTPVPSEDGESEADAPVETPEPTRDPSLPVYEQDGSILLTLSFTGDVTIGTNVQASSSIFEKELKKQKGDITFPFRNVRDIFLADDMTMVNFEGTLTTAGKNPKKRDYSFLFRADPSYVAMLPAGGIDTVSFENNHADDMGEEGLKETKETLLAAGIPYASEDEPAIITVKGVKIGSLAYQTFNGRHDELIEKVPADIAALRAQGCEFIVVSYHWGAEKDYSPNDNQVRLGRATIDAGADLVTVHVESDFPENIQAAIDKIHAKGKKAGIVLKPKTTWEAVLPYIDQVELILVMTVEPGFGGQKFMADQMPKVAAIRKLIDERNPVCELEVDGGVAPDTCRACIDAGANVLVAGSAVYKAEDIPARIKLLRGE